MLIYRQLYPQVQISLKCGGKYDDFVVCKFVGIVFRHMLNISVTPGISQHMATSGAAFDKKISSGWRHYRFRVAASVNRKHVFFMPSSNPNSNSNSFFRSPIPVWVQLLLVWWAPARQCDGHVLQEGVPRFTWITWWTDTIRRDTLRSSTPRYDDDVIMTSDMPTITQFA